MYYDFGKSFKLLLIAFTYCNSPLSSRLTVLACDSAWATSILQHVFEYPPKWCTYNAGMALLNLRDEYIIFQ